jgi:small GTP-binding protein
MKSFSDGPDASSHKVVLLGDSRVGKTSIITRQMLGYQPATQNPTIGCHCSDIHFPLDGQEVSLQVWDTAGQEMYRALVPVYLRNARAALLVYDVTDRESFQSLGHWHDTLLAVVPSGVRVYVVGNKIDLEDSAVIEDVQAKQFADVHSAQFFKVSAATGVGLDALFEKIAREMSEGAVLQQQGSVLDTPAQPKRGCEC